MRGLLVIEVFEHSDSGSSAVLRRRWPKRPQDPPESPALRESPPTAPPDGIVISSKPAPTRKRPSRSGDLPGVLGIVAILALQPLRCSRRIGGRSRNGSCSGV